MKRYRRYSKLYQNMHIVLEAMQLSWETWSEMCTFAKVGKLVDGRPEGCFFIGTKPEEHSSEKLGLLIPSTEGLYIGRQNDWIVKELGDKLCVYSPDLFGLTFEKIEEKEGAGQK